MAIDRIVERLGLMKGLPQKIGQLLAFSEVESSDQSFMRLTESEGELSSASELSALERLLGAPLDALFSSFDPKGVSASIGRVYRAVLKNGCEVAVKAQHPGVAEVVEYDLKALGWITTPLGGMKKGFDVDSYRQEIGQSLRSELDYRLEAENMREFAFRVKSLPGKVIVPEVVDALSNERALTTTWLSGERLSEAIHWPLEARQAISQSLLDLFFNSSLDWGVLHADPHPGNYRFLFEEGVPAVGLLDFGCVKRLSRSAQASLQELIRMGLAGDYNEIRLLTLFERMGFDAALLKGMKEKLGAVGAVLLEPFASRGAFDVSEWRLGERLKEVLGEDRMAFRTAGPSDLVFILRSFQGLVQYLRLLDAPVAWRDAAIAALTACAAIEPEQPKTSFQDSKSNIHAELLRIQILENGEEKISLTFGAKVAANLRDLLPEDLRGKMKELQIDLEAIERRVEQTAFQADELISISEGSKKIKVWLE